MAPIGYLMLGGSGSYVVIGNNPNRPTTTGPSGDGFAANFGTWSIDEGAKTFSFRVVGVLNRSNEGTENS